MQNYQETAGCAASTSLFTLAPARWIWWPSQRTLPNTFVLFRRPFIIDSGLVRATGWISADSRYRLTLDGERVQWGPAPCDPRWLDADPIDILGALTPGTHVLGVEVLFYGHGEGTWVGGKPGMICSLTFEYANGSRETLCSDASWQALLDRSHAPGHYQRWLLRALQEEYDLRLRPQGWDTPAYRPDSRWLPAMELDAAPDLPVAYGSYREYLTDAVYIQQETDYPPGGIRPRLIPLLHEELYPAQRLVDGGILHWLRDPRDWFESRTPGCFTLTRSMASISQQEDGWMLFPSSSPTESLSVIFTWSEQLVGWPYCIVEAPAGTIVELISQESHDPEKTAWLDTHYFTWTRFICREGENILEPFDFESLRWLQLHIRNASGPVRIRTVAIRRRSFPWQKVPVLHCSDPALQKLLHACITTLTNSAQETIVDGMGRERQQYSGDCGHQLHAIRAIYGETRLVQRYIETFSQGLTPNDLFLDCWPGIDRLTRIAQRQIGATSWGPLLDHGIGFIFDCWHHVLESGEKEVVRLPYVHLQRFARMLTASCTDDDVLPVEHLGIASVWLDHDAYRQQKHKQCAFTLYAAAMLTHALAPLAVLLDDPSFASWCSTWGQKLLHGTIARFWSNEHHCFVANLPWVQEEEVRMDDRALATALLFDQFPDQESDHMLSILLNAPSSMGLSYPPNALWRYRALARWGRMDGVLHELRTRWASLSSVLANQTIQEDWSVQTDSTSQWSHCGIVPLNIFHMDIAGVRPVEPGFARYVVRPQLGDLDALDIEVQTPYGPLTLRAQREEGGHQVMIQAPKGCEGTVLIAPSGRPVPPSLLRGYPLQPGTWNTHWCPELELPTTGTRS